MRSAEVIFILSMISLENSAKELNKENRDLFDLFYDPHQPLAKNQLDLVERSRS